MVWVVIIPINVTMFDEVVQIIPFPVKEESPVKDSNSLERDADEEPQQLNGNNVSVETVCITSNGFEVSEVLPEANPTLCTELSESPVVENGTPFR